MQSDTKLLAALAQQLTTELESMFLRFMGVRASKYADALDLKPRDVMLLAIVAGRGPLPMSAVAEALDLPLSTATHQVDRLVQQGLITRGHGATDRRVVEIRITDKGSALNRRLHEGRVEMSLAMLRTLSPGERQMLVELFSKINGRSWDPQG